jgi:hypothetical protein
MVTSMLLLKNKRAISKYVVDGRKRGGRNLADKKGVGQWPGPNRFVGYEFIYLKTIAQNTEL